MSERRGRVYLVGAGPGDPGLITLRGLRCLAQADAVLYDYLVNPAILEHAPPHAERLPLGDPEGGRALSQERLYETLVELAEQGRTVVHLKGGDPFIFGRGGEEAEALRRAGIDFEIVPGVTAGIGAAAYAGIPLTHRDRASAVVFATAHEDPTKEVSQLDYEFLARFRGTLVFYMGAARVEAVAAALLKAGKDPQTPVAVIVAGTLPQQRCLWATLETAAAEARTMPVVSPAVIIVGPVVTLGQSLQWFERRPLFGQRIVVTRPEEQGRELAARLEELGAETLLWPTIRIEPPQDWGPVDRALARLDEYNWLVFTSANGVSFFLERLEATGGDLRRLGGVRLAAIGPGTREVLARYHLRPDVMPAEYRAEQLAAALAGQMAAKRVLLARASRGRKVLPEQLAAAGAVVEEVAVYQSVDIEQADPAVLDTLRRGQVDWITLTSSAITRSLVRMLDDDLRQRLGREIRLVSISPVTTQTARELGLPVTAEAKTYTIDGVVEALIAACTPPRPSHGPHANSR